jgi:hypothetical protein
MKRNSLFAAEIKKAGIDLNKDFYELTNTEIFKVDEIRKSLKYSGYNTLMRSKVRQFWYAAQKAK